MKNNKPNYNKPNNNKYNKNSNIKYYKCNNIAAKNVVVIDETGQMLGEMATSVAQEIALSKNLDLIEVNGKVNPPIVKIADYSKFIYEQKKRAKDKAKSQRLNKSDNHIIQIHPETDSNDLKHKYKQIREFLNEGDTVTFKIISKGRRLPINFKQLCKDMMDGCLNELKDIATYDGIPKFTARTYEVLLRPAKN